MYEAFISKHLSPFIMTTPARVLLPGKKERGAWKPIYASDLALMNSSTAFVFRRISDTIGEELVPYLEDKINIYGKLYQQNFATGNWLVLSSASGSNPCAAYISLADYDRARLIIDQTLYWYLASSEEEALYIVGILNSKALADAINDFQPEGGFGKRHIHTLPYKITPVYDPANEAHVKVALATKRLMDEWKAKCESGICKNLLDPNSSTLNSRRRRQQGIIKTLDAYDDYEAICAVALQG